MSVGEQSYTIGELARAFGLTLRSIRHYEEQGLILPAREGASRRFNHRDRARLALICRGKRLGFSLPEIKEFLDLYEVGGGQVEQLRYALIKGRRRIADLERQRADLDQTLAELRGLMAEVVDHLKRHGIEETLEGGSVKP